MAKKTAQTSKARTRTSRAAGGRATKAGRKAGRTRARAKASRSRTRKTPRAAKHAKKKPAPARRKKAARPASRAARRPSTRRTTAAKRPRPASGSRSARAAQATRKKAQPVKPAKKKKVARPREGMERTLSQTPQAGRTVKGPTNPMPTKRSTGTPAGAGSTRRIPGLDRERRKLREIEEEIQTPPSSLDMDRMASAARTGRAEMQQARREHTETSPVMTGGDVDANWAGAYAEGDEAPGGDNPTPDQDRVDDIGKALGVTYEDNEELKASDKIAERDRHRWELDPASSEDYRTRDRDLDEE